MKTYVYIGRFQPVHNAHIAIIERALKEADHVVVLVGSANQPRTYKNPWTAIERMAMISNSLSAAEKRISFGAIRDHQYNDTEWATEVQETVARLALDTTEVSIIGHSKDESSYYLKMFPQWNLVEHPLVEELSATDVRDLYFREKYNSHFISAVVPSAVLDFLNRFRDTPEYAQVLNERKFIDTYKKQFEHLKYPPVFVTVDSVVIQSGHVLMVQRKSEPGRGLWALPGGFLDARRDPSVKAAAIRELREETKIKVPAAVLNGSITGERVFDAVNRSARGRTITHAFKIELPWGELSKVKAASDAQDVRWVPISEIRSETCFEDHYDIIKWATGVI